MSKYKMPTVQQFLKRKKKKYHKEPVWVYLEKEMLDNIHKKPYNEKVGNWLRFLRDLKYYYYCEEKRKLKRLNREVGPPWYCELSKTQQEILATLKSNIHQDLIADTPARTRKSLSDLGLTFKIPKAVLMKAIKDSTKDPGVFIWYLYSAYYKKPPSELQSEYDLNAKILMSCLVFVDLLECIQRLEDLTRTSLPPPSIPKKKVKKNPQPNVRYGEYLQKFYIPCYSNHSSENKKPKKQPPRLEFKVQLRSDDSYEKLCQDHGFLAKRIERNTDKSLERICTYKFWEPPSSLRNADPKMVAYIIKLKMLKQRAKPKFKSPYKNVQFHIGAVAFVGGRPRYLLNNVALMPTGYVPINDGIACYNAEYITIIQGYWKFPKVVKAICEESCSCLTQWEEAVMEYLKQSKCKCGHLYDLNNTGKVTEKYFYQPTSHGPYWLDNAKIYQMDPMEDFIRDTTQDFWWSKEPTAFLAELSETPLLIPHLPKACLLNNLQEWTRKRVKGNLTAVHSKKLLQQSQRRWADLENINFQARPHRIPFTHKVLTHLNWSHRHLVQKLFEILLENFVRRNRVKQLNQTRLLWPTMKHDAYPSDQFLNVFFTYMPGRLKDTFLINPYDSDFVAKHGAKTCPLSN